MYMAQPTFLLCPVLRDAGEKLHTYMYYRVSLTLLTFVNFAKNLIQKHHKNRQQLSNSVRDRHRDE